MKINTLAILAILTVSTLKSVGQKLEENKKDDFTNKTIKRTSWETLNSSSAFTAYFRISQVDDSEVFDVKLMMDKVFSIESGAEIMFKMDNDEIIKLPNINYARTCMGCGATGLKGSEAPGIQTSYALSKEQAEKLKTGKIVKVRIATSAGYVENDIKDKISEKVQKSIALI